MKTKEETKYSGNIKNPKVVAKELNRILKRNKNKLTAELVVEDARDPKSPLHSYFTWDDTEAGAKWRLWEAQHMIRSVKVEYTTRENKPVLIRGFFNVQSNGHGPINGEESDVENRRYYVTSDRALSNPSYREQLLADAASDAKTFRNKYAALTELVHVFEALDEFEKSIEVKK